MFRYAGFLCNFKHKQSPNLKLYAMTCQGLNDRKYKLVTAVTASFNTVMETNDRKCLSE